MATITISMPLDPKLLSVNRRYRSNEVLPAEVKKAQGDIITVTRATAHREGIVFADETLLQAAMVFTFRNERGDLDNAIKRTLDAIAAGMGFNDERIVDIHARRFVGEPGLWAKVAEVDPGDDPSLDEG